MEPKQRNCGLTPSQIQDLCLAASKAIAQLRNQGFKESEIPAPSTMALILNRMGYRLRKVLKAKPQKKFPKPMPSLRISASKTKNRMRKSNV